MSATVANNGYGSIGRMFARQNAPSVYGMQKAASALEQETASDRVDQVSLSPFAPRPLTADFLRSAMQAGESLGQGKTPSGEEADRLREDRVFAAVSALALLGYSGDQPVNWPGGFSSPTKEELEMARRRLAQRPQNLQETDSPEQLQQQRLELLEKVAKRDFSQVGFGAAQQNTTATTAA